jgi:hypothetical protein
MGWVKKLWLSVSYKIKSKLPCIGKYEEKYEEKCVQYILCQNRPSVIEEGRHY